MNSMSKNYYKDDCEPCKKEKRQYCPTFLACGPVAGSVPIPDGLTTTSPLPLTTVAVNIPRHCDPCVKIEFASTVTVDVQGSGDVAFTVAIFKNCANNFRIPIGSYSYALDVTGNETSTTSFSFFVCDCNAVCSSECCYYSAEVTASTIDAPGGGTTDAPSTDKASVTINGAALAALVVDSGC